MSNPLNFIESKTWNFKNRQKLLIRLPSVLKGADLGFYIDKILFSLFFLQHPFPNPHIYPIPRGDKYHPGDEGSGDGQRIALEWLSLARPRDYLQTWSPVVAQGQREQPREANRQGADGGRGVYM